MSTCLSKPRLTYFIFFPSLSTNLTQAGIPRKNLTIGLEPECASLYCQQLPAQKLSGFCDYKKIGLKYMILDNGGKNVIIF